MAFVQIILNSLIAAGIYALIAYGFSIVYSTNKIVHFAHGGMIAIAGYAFFAVSKHVSIIPAIGFSLLISLIIGFLFHYYILGSTIHPVFSAL
ncbi:MAG: ABC transporter permease subunit [Candidatus Woesearchaeota archaeon]